MASIRQAARGFGVLGRRAHGKAGIGRASGLNCCLVSSPPPGVLSVRCGQAAEATASTLWGRGHSTRGQSSPEPDSSIETSQERTPSARTTYLEVEHAPALDAPPELDAPPGLEAPPDFTSWSAGASSYGFSGADKLDASSGAVVNFGKYRGRSFEDVATMDPSYCEWVVRKSDSGNSFGALDAFATFLRGRGTVANTRTFDSSPRAYSSAPAGQSSYGRAQGGGVSKYNSMTTIATYGSSSTWTGSSGSFEGDSGPSVASGELQLTFGKHSGRTFAEVYRSDKQYCDWIVDKAMSEPCTRKQQAAMWMFVAYVQHRNAGPRV